MPVSGIVLTCSMECAYDVASRVATLDGVEVHGVLPDGRIIVVVEADTVEAEVALVSGLHDIGGVMSVGLAYHNFEDIPHKPC